MPDPAIAMNGTTEIHYFEKEEGTEVKFFTMVAEKATNKIVRSFSPTPAADNDQHIDDRIAIYKKEGYTHHRI